jgi:hypothetical protein
MMTVEVTKQVLLQRLQASYAHFHQIITPLTSSQLETKGVIGSWSIKDTVAHFIAHEQFALRELAAAQGGETYDNPYEDVDTMNAVAVEQYTYASLDQVLLDWDISFQQIVTAVEALDETDFAADSPVVDCLNDTIDGALANNTYEHYAEHIPSIQAWIAHQ